jgi:hypothetical protein
VGEGASLIEEADRSGRGRVGGVLFTAETAGTAEDRGYGRRGVRWTERLFFISTTQKPLPREKIRNK